MDLPKTVKDEAFIAFALSHICTHVQLSRASHRIRTLSQARETPRALHSEGVHSDVRPGQEKGGLSL